MDSSVKVWVEQIIPKYVLGYSEHHRDSLVWFNAQRPEALPQFVRGMTQWAAEEMMRRKADGEKETMKITPIRDSDQYIVQRSNRTLDEALDSKIKEGQIPAFATQATREDARAQYIQWLGIKGVPGDAFYFASLSKGCDCPYFLERLMPCKHLWALVKQFPHLSMTSVIQNLVPSHMIMLDPEVTSANNQVALDLLPPPPAPSRDAAGPSATATRRPDPYHLMNQDMTAVKRDFDCLVKAGYEMEDETRREFLQAVSELKARFGGPSISQSLFINNQMPIAGSRASSRTSKVIKSARTNARKRGRVPQQTLPSGPIIEGEFTQKSKKKRQGDFMSHAEIQEGTESVKFADREVS